MVSTTRLRAPHTWGTHLVVDEARVLVRAFSLVGRRAHTRCDKPGSAMPHGVTLDSGVAGPGDRVWQQSEREEAGWEGTGDRYATIHYRER